MQNMNTDDLTETRARLDKLRQDFEYNTFKWSKENEAVRK